MSNDRGYNNFSELQNMPDSNETKEYYSGFCYVKPDQVKPKQKNIQVGADYLTKTTTGCASQPMGVKYDDDKLRYDLIPPLALDELVKVLTHGAKKYDDDNWRNVENWKKRYFAATQRHQWQWKRGKIMDNEADTKGNPGSNCHHIACAIASLMFLLEKELEGENTNDQSRK